MSNLSAELLKKRQTKLTEHMQAAGMDAIIINPSPSITYLTGMHYHLSERPVVVIFPANGTPVLILPELESAKAKNLEYDLDVFTYGEDPSTWPGVYAEGLKAAGLSANSTIGAEARYIRMLELDLIKAALPAATLQDASETVAKLRMYKDASEKEALQQATNIAQKALEETLPLIKIGMTEKEVQAELIMQLYRQGSHSPFPFMPIVASGPVNSPNPHAFASDNTLKAGDLLVIDWGANFDGYYSDLTRTFAIGTITEELAKIHQTVQDANQAAHGAAKPGVSCGDVDKAARDVIEAAGYGEYFFHRLGHGLGMEGHEEPYMRSGNPMLLEPGMVFTIEPGIYIMNKGGVRIEDDVIVTEDGLHSFSDMFRGLRIVG